jgi:hypothetical protein
VADLRDRDAHPWVCSTDESRRVAMGLVRKTFSVATLGIVSFRSKKEQLRRADKYRQDAEKVLAKERAARESAERRIATAEERVKHAIGEAAQVAQRLEKANRKRKAKGGRRRAGALAGVLAAADHAAREAGAEAGRAGRRAGKAATHATHTATKQTRRSLKRATKSTKNAVNPVAARISERVGDALDHVPGH